MKSPETRRALATFQRDRRNSALLGLGATYALIAAAFAAVAWSPGWGAGALAFVGIGLMQYRLVLASHEAVHGAFLHPSWLNELAGVLCASLVGLNFHRYRHQHLTHHRARDLDHDPDAYIYRPILEARPGLRRLGALLFGTVSEAIEKVRQEGPTHHGAHAEDPRTARAHTLAVLGAQGALFAILTASLGWWAWPLLWVGPLGTVALLVNRIRVFVEHGYAYAGAEAWGRDLGSCPVRTVDLVSHPIERFFVSGFSFNYHNAHHFAPGVPHYRLHDLMELLEREEPGYAPPVRRSYAATLAAMLLGR